VAKFKYLRITVTNHSHFTKKLREDYTGETHVAIYFRIFFVENKTQSVKHVLQMQQLSLLPTYKKSISKCVFHVCSLEHRFKSKSKDSVFYILPTAIKENYVVTCFNESLGPHKVCKFCMWGKYVVSLSAL